jgi:hypothetical protein
MGSFFWWRNSCARLATKNGTQRPMIGPFHPSLIQADGFIYASSLWIKSFANN